MKFEPINPVINNKLFRATKLQALLDAFISSDQSAVHCIIEPGEYSSIRSASSSFRTAIRRMGYPISVRVLNGELYLIKLITKEIKV